MSDVTVASPAATTVLPEQPVSAHDSSALISMRDLWKTEPDWLSRHTQQRRVLAERQERLRNG